jgi:subtilisin-like proprotein convertase family protein
MRIIVTLLSALLTLSLSSQTFNGAGGAIQNNGVETYFNCSVSGLSQTKLDSVFGLEEVCISITHPHVEEIYVFLISPSGRTVEITEGLSCGGENYTGTCFNSNVANPITSGSAPYTGTFRPIGYLGRFNDGQPGQGTWKLVVKDYLAFVNSGSLVSWSLRFSNSPPKPVILTSSNLPLVIINTNNSVISDTKQLVDFAVIDNGPGNRNHPSDPRNNYNAKAMVHIRGNTTRNFEKKAYAVELRSSQNPNLKMEVPILGMPADSDWELIAEYQDKTLMRIPMTYMLARKMGRYAPRSKYVEVILNGEYAGVYALVEKIKRGSFRVDIRKMTTADNALPLLSGGYLFHIDRTDAAGWYSSTPGQSQNGSHFYYQYDDPKDSTITAQQQTYLQNYMAGFEAMMNSSSFADPQSGYRKYIDVGSAVDFLVINEMCKNVDAYRLSSYLYKQDDYVGGKLNFGPVWDFDLAWDNCNYGNTFDPAGWEYELQDTVHPQPVWWSRFMSDPYFLEAVSCRWQSCRRTLLSNNSVYEVIDSTAAALNEAQARNFRQWPIMGTYIFPNPQNQAGATYAGEVGALKSWLASRFSWIDGQMQNKCSTLSLSNNFSNPGVELYPNPLERNSPLMLHVTETARIAVTVTDALGRVVRHIPEESMSAGSHMIDLRGTTANAGIYICTLSVNGVQFSRKLLVN